MDIFLHGVRGSIPSPSFFTQFYGANTSCFEVRTRGGDMLIFDAGSGLRSLGDALPETGECHLFITHRHSDHIAGLGFFRPFFLPGWTIHLYLPQGQEDLVHAYFNGIVFPVCFADLPAKVSIAVVRDGQRFSLPAANGVIRIACVGTNHPGGNLSYRVETDEATFFYSGDHEISANEQVRALTGKLLANADIAIVDAHFNRENFQPGWGHSTWEDWAQIAQEVGVKCLVLSHHAPESTDIMLDLLQRQVSAAATGDMNIVVAREEMRFAPGSAVLPEIIASDWLQQFIETIGKFKEEGVILDAILKKTREVTAADAGTVFLLDEGELVFSYTHNDSLFPANESSKHAYANLRMPCSTDSIAGFVACTGVTLNIPDVRAIPASAPYKFNDSFDKATGYCTHSVLVLPLKGTNQRIMGVLQLINSMNPRDGKPRPFTESMTKTVKLLGIEACKVLEISSAITDNIYRLLHIAAIHDPTETGPHASRVGAIAAEIYQTWALAHKVPVDEAMNFRSHLRLAAMLHDIGKVGISDTILKKPGKLDEAEFTIMKTHAEKGAELFASQQQDISSLALDITLHHHQKWNGKGYGETGKPPLAGEDIPLAARITAIADVFDALVSPRCYKAPWPFDKAVEHIVSEAGQHFDPELVTYFTGLLDIVGLIYQRFPENRNPRPSMEEKGQA